MTNWGGTARGTYRSTEGHGELTVDLDNEQGHNKKDKILGGGDAHADKHDAKKKKKKNFEKGPGERPTQRKKGDEKNEKIIPAEDPLKKGGGWKTEKSSKITRDSTRTNNAIRGEK